MRPTQVGGSRVAVRRLLITAGLLLGSACSDGPSSSPRAAVPEETREISDALLADAQELAKDLGISVEDALAALERQPMVGRLGKALEERGPASFGGLFIDYVPDYRITLLSLPGGGDEVLGAADDLGFAELSPFTVARETPYTEDVLKEAQRMWGSWPGSR